MNSQLDDTGVLFRRWVNSHRRKFQVWHCYSGFGQCLGGRNSYKLEALADKDRLGDNALNLQPRRRACEAWSRIELRILDSRMPHKASIWGGSLCVRRSRCSSALPASSPAQLHRPAAETLRSLQSDKRGVLIKWLPGPCTPAQAFFYILAAVAALFPWCLTA